MDYYINKYPIKVYLKKTEETIKVIEENTILSCNHETEGLLRNMCHLTILSGEYRGESFYRTKSDMDSLIREYEILIPVPDHLQHLQHAGEFGLL